MIICKQQIFLSVYVDDNNLTPFPFPASINWRDGEETSVSVQYFIIFLFFKNLFFDHHSKINWRNTLQNSWSTLLSGPSPATLNGSSETSWEISSEEAQPFPFLRSQTSQSSIMRWAPPNLLSLTFQMSKIWAFKKKFFSCFNTWIRAKINKCGEGDKWEEYLIGVYYM